MGFRLGREALTGLHKVLHGDVPKREVRVKRQQPPESFLTIVILKYSSTVAALAWRGLRVLEKKPGQSWRFALRPSFRWHNQAVADGYPASFYRQLFWNNLCWIISCVDACLKHSASSVSLLKLQSSTFCCPLCVCKGGAQNEQRANGARFSAKSKKSISSWTIWWEPLHICCFFFLHHEEHLDFCPRLSEPIAFSDGPFYNDDALSDN